jgi:hypothetical protein
MRKLDKGSALGFGLFIFATLVVWKLTEILPYL